MSIRTEAEIRERLRDQETERDTKSRFSDHWWLNQQMVLALEWVLNDPEPEEGGE